MRPIRLRLRAELRQRRWSWAAIVAVVGVVAGVTFSLAAGARRTDSAYPRFLAAFPASDYTVADSSDFGFTSRLDLEAVRRLPQVRAASRVSGLIAVAARRDADTAFPPGVVVPFAPLDRAVGRSVERWKLVDGRRADPRRPDEAVIGFEMARAYGLEVGSRLTIEFLRRDTFARLGPGFIGCAAERIGADPSPTCADARLSPDPPDLEMTFRVVGIQASALEFPPYEGNLNPPVHLTRAFTERFAGDLVGSDILLVRLRSGVDAHGFLDDLAATQPGTTVSVLSIGADHARTVQRSIHLQAVSLGILAALVALAAALAIGQAFSRLTYVAVADDLTTLRALGWTRRQLVGAAVVRAGGIAAAGVVVAAGIALATSPQFPVGLALDAEPDPGPRIDALVFGIGAAAVLALASTVSAVTAWRASTRSSTIAPRTRPTRVARVVEMSRLPLTAGIGVRQALEVGRGRTAVPVRSAIAAVALGVTVLVTAMTLASSTDHLLETRHLFGWSRDAQIGSDGTPSIAREIGAGLERRRDVSAYSIGTVTDLGIAGHRISAFALDDARGRVPIDLLEGRRPADDDEIVLGTRTLRDLGSSVGDRVLVEIGGQRVPMTVTGRAVFSRIGNNGQLGRGAQITFSALRRVLPDAPQNVVHIAFARGADGDAVRAELQEAIVALPVLGPDPPTELTSFGRVDNLPWYLAAGMMTLAAAILAHTLVTTIQRRRHDFAVLRSLGFVRSQVSATVAVQATTGTVVALAIGIPLGLLLGRRAWDAIASELGVPAETVVDPAALLVAAPALLLLANVVAAVPAWIAGRTRPESSLRAE